MLPGISAWSLEQGLCSFTTFFHRRALFQTAKMYMMYYIDDVGKRVYTLKKVDPCGKPTMSAHPARFSPDDKFSEQRLALKRRFGILLTQTPKPAL